MTDRFLPPAAGVVDVWLLPLDAPALPAPVLHGFLSSRERARAERFVFDRDRRRFMTARGLLRSVLGAALDYAPNAVPLDTGVNGRPVLLDASTVRFNLSHSGEWVAIALLASSSPVALGVDIEVMRPLHDLDALARGVYVASELAEIAACEREADRVATFHRLWTRKEACMKSTGAGFALPPEQFGVQANARVQAVVLPPHDLAPAGITVTVHDVEGAVGCAGALAVEGAEWTVRVRSAHG